MTNPSHAPKNLSRFDAYRVQPVVETTAPNGFERSYEAFPNLAEAEAELKRFDSKNEADDRWTQVILWSVYGLRRGIAEHILDRSSQADAFALLFAIAGINGKSGQIDYPVLPLWIVVHEHRSGTEIWVVASVEMPTIRQIVDGLDIDFEPHREEVIWIHPFDRVDTLETRDGDDAPLDKSQG